MLGFLCYNMVVLSGQQCTLVVALFGVDHMDVFPPLNRGHIKGN